MNDIQDIADSMSDGEDEFSGEDMAALAIERHIFHPIDIKSKMNGEQLDDLTVDKINEWNNENPDVKISDNTEEVLRYVAWSAGITNQSGLSDPADMLEWVKSQRLVVPYFVIDGLKSHIRHSERMGNV